MYPPKLEGLAVQTAPPRFSLGPKLVASSSARPAATALPTNTGTRGGELRKGRGEERTGLRLRKRRGEIERASNTAIGVVISVGLVRSSRWVDGQLVCNSQLGPAGGRAGGQGRQKWWTRGRQARRPADCPPAFHDQGPRGGGPPTAGWDVSRNWRAAIGKEGM